jgi:hypothetical protein
LDDTDAFHDWTSRFFLLFNVTMQFSRFFGWNQNSSILSDAFWISEPMLTSFSGLGFGLAGSE